MARDEYVRDICARSGAAVDVPFKPDAFIGHWKPNVADCHANVNYWVKHHVGYTAVRGWTYLMGSEPGPVDYAAHTVLRGPDGELFDITPVEDSDFIPRRFIEHLGDERTFQEMRAGIYIKLSCEGDQPASQPDPMWALQNYTLPSDEGL